MIILKNEFLTCRFADAGMLESISSGDLDFSVSGVYFDFAADRHMASGLLQYESLEDFRTWNLPAVRPTGNPFALTPAQTEFIDNVLYTTYHLPQFQVTLSCQVCGSSLVTSLEIINTSQKPVDLSTCAFLLRLPVEKEMVADFPGTAPVGHYLVENLEEQKPVETGLVSFATCVKTAHGALDAMFIDPVEKWTSAVYRQGDACWLVFDASLEVRLAPASSCRVGTLYLSPCADDPYLHFRKLTEELGYRPYTQGIHDGVMYSCHPAGTMDTGFPLKRDLFEYAEELPRLKQMGVDHVWLLPVFDHDERGVYHSNDQSVISRLYGGEEGCRYFCEKAHELGMRILFDYVPHGPVPEHPLVSSHPEWPSKKKDGSLQIEWDCVSMDYNHPGYQDYTSRLVEDHVRRFGTDGARIDCAMGGLSNWRPYPGYRPSASSVAAGVHITEAIQRGFLNGGKKSLILPENFNLIPPYYACTDIFYGMNFYRALVELEPLFRQDPAAFSEGVVDFLERESKITPPGLRKMRFLGNHDTVSWVWQKARAQDIYGTQGAKAMFALISLIDGVPMIYQGDEDPSVYGGKGEKLDAFFARLFHDRKKWIPAGSNETTYLHTHTPVMAFWREPVKDIPAFEKNGCETQGTSRVLVLINLSPDVQPCGYQGDVLADSAPGSPDSLAPYSYRILQA